jgi:hypothetical protein
MSELSRPEEESGATVEYEKQSHSKFEIVRLQSFMHTSITVLVKGAPGACNIEEK